MFPFLRDNERSRSDPSVGIPGLRVTCLASGKFWFFPGGTAELAMILARAALYDQTLDHPRTEIAFGEKRGSVWIEQSVVKASVG